MSKGIFAGWARNPQRQERKKHNNWLRRIPEPERKVIMKHMTLRTLALVTALALTASPAFAEDGGETADTATEYTFRGIPWYSTRADAEKALEEEGIEVFTTTDDLYRIGATDSLSVIHNDDLVDGAGVHVRYSGAEVAGFDPSDTCACYIYMTGDDGKLIKDDDAALFYMGWYEFYHSYFVDPEAIYNDLLTKLTSLYGEPAADIGETDEDLWTDTWTDSSRNIIRLLINGMDDDKNHDVTLTYYAAGSDDYLDVAKDALLQEAAENEAAEMERNQENTSGL